MRPRRAARTRRGLHAPSAWPGRLGFPASRSCCSRSAGIGLEYSKKGSALPVRGNASKSSEPKLEGQKERRGIQSIEVGAPLLDALAAAPTPLALKDLTAATGLAASQAHRYLASYGRIGLVRQDDATGRYDLGDLALRLGLSALARVDYYEMANAAALDVSRRANLTTLVVIWGPIGPIIVRLVRSNPPLVVNLNVGSILPALTSASGRVLVSFSPPEVTEAVLCKELKEASRTTEEVAGWTMQIRARGFETVSGSVIPGLAAASAPILDSQGVAVAAVTLLKGGALAIPDDVVADLNETCRQVSRRTGYREASALPDGGAS